MSNIAADTQWLDATAQAELVADGEVSAREMIDAAIELLAEVGPSAMPFGTSPSGPG